MTFADLVNHGKKFLADNAPTILAGVGAVGVVGTAYLTGKATFKAYELLQAEKLRQAEEHGVTVRDPNQVLLTPQEKAKLCWRLYLPAAGVGALTIAAIVGSNRISSNRAAGVAAAYSLSTKAFKEYKEHVKEKFGENKAREVQDEIAQKKVNENPPSGDMLIVGAGKILCKDAWTGRYFHSTMETIKAAQNSINYQALAGEFPSLTDFYHEINSPQLRPTTASESVGWNDQNKLELVFSAALVEAVEGQGTVPCMVVSFLNEPQPNYWKPSAVY